MTVMEITDLLDEVGSTNFTIFDGLVKANSVINNPQYKTIICSISGGSDSDIVLDICHKIDKDKKIIYVWFDTGLEYQATKDHLKFLEEKYQIEIKREKAKMPIPISNKKFGHPFVSKQVSEWMERLQRHNFEWENEPFEVLYKKYPRCKAALKWWCNKWTNEDENPSKSRFNIAYNKWLKEFLVENPPTIKISGKCCKGAKKDVIKDTLDKYNADLNIYGVRKAEGGARAGAYKTCYDIDLDVPQYRPIFWYKNEDKLEYEKIFNINHSECYTKYGLQRTGCAGCPFGGDFEEELRIIRTYEPKLEKGINNIFKDSYEYTKKYLEFYAKKQADEKEADEKPQGQFSLYDYFKEF